MKEELEKLFGENLQIVEGLNSEVYLPVEEANLQNTLKTMAKNNFELISLFWLKTLLRKGSHSFTPLKKQVTKKFWFCSAV